MIAPDDARHGTTRGYSAGCHEACCRAAEARRRHELRVAHYLGRPQSIDPTGTIRRIHALMAIGWTTTQLGQRIGYGSTALNQITRCREWVMRETADKVRTLYDELSMTPGPSAETRKRAARKGWVPPLAWDDESIDDPRAKPYQPTRELKRDRDIDEVAVYRALLGERINLTKRERLEVARLWQQRGRSLNELDRIHGWNVQRDIRETRAAA